MVHHWRVVLLQVGAFACAAPAAERTDLGFMPQALGLSAACGTLRECCSNGHWASSVIDLRMKRALAMLKTVFIHGLEAP